MLENINMADFIGVNLEEIQGIFRISDDEPLNPDSVMWVPSESKKGPYEVSVNENDFTYAMKSMFKEHGLKEGHGIRIIFKKFKYWLMWNGTIGRRKVDEH